MDEIKKLIQQWQDALNDTRVARSEYYHHCNALEGAYEALVEAIEEVDSKDHPRGSELEKILGISEVELMDNHSEMVDLLWTWTLSTG